MWPADQPLEEALWHLLFSTSPDAAYAKSCKASVAISIGPTGHAAEMRIASAILRPSTGT
jgi:hypothetical protein